MEKINLFIYFLSKIENKYIFKKYKHIFKKYKHIFYIYIMEKERNTDFVKLEDGLVLNINHIHWIKKVHDCMYISTKTNDDNTNTSHVICGSNDMQKKNFEKLNIMFR